MGDEYERQRHEDRVLSAMYRLDPDKLAAIRRATSGKTRCPECDTVNPADQRKCYKCGANLYYDLPDEEEPKDKGKQEDVVEPKDKRYKPEDDSNEPPYY